MLNRKRIYPSPKNVRRKSEIIVPAMLVLFSIIIYEGCSPLIYEATRVALEEKYSAPLYKDWGTLNPNSFGRAASPSVVPRQGIVTTNISVNDEITSAARQTDGKIVAAGIISRDFALVRYNSNGSLDATFGDNGIVRTNFFSSTDTRNEGIASIVIQPDGRIVAGGTVLQNGGDFNNYDFGLARYNTDGSLDATFGTGGKVITNVAANKADAITSLALQADGKIVAAGFNGAPRSPQQPADFLVARYNSNGSLDATFGTNGIVTTDFGNDSDFGLALVIQTDGKMIVGGCAYDFVNTHSFDFAMARYNSNGTLDATFGSGGKVIYDAGDSSPNNPRGDSIISMALQTDGKILAAGTGEPNRSATDSDFVIARFNVNGTLDTTFGANGRVVTDFNGSTDFASSIALQPDGRFVVAGVADGQLQNDLLPRLKVRYDSSVIRSATISDFAVARYNPNGSLDSSFGTGGKAQTDIFGSLDAAIKVLILPNGNILALGFTQTTAFGSGQDDSALDFASVMYQGAVLQRRKLNDFDGDGRAEFAVFRLSNGAWYIQNTNVNSSRPAFRAVQFGQSGDKPVAGDYDGDGRADIAVFRSGIWYILQSSDNLFRAVQFGAETDKPVPDDYDGDGKTDIAVFRPANGTWYLQRSNLGFTGVQFGTNGDVPVNGDYDGDGKSDVAVYRPANGTWYRLNSSNGAFSGAQFGAAEDKPVVGDYDADGIYDLAVFRPSNGTWYVQKSAEGFSAAQFGVSTDLPVPADYDGDQRTDFAVFRPSSGIWYVLQSANGFTGIQFGASGDVPVPATP